MKKAIFILFTLTVQLHLFPQTETREGIRIMFYNVENLFDTINDPATNDDDFTPKGNYHWNNFRLNKKLNNIYKVIVSAGETEPPEIIAFAEVENKKVIEKLIFNTPLSKYKYSIVHKDSPDERGIDVALIYRPDKIKKISSDYFQIFFKTRDKTRDILLFSFANHKNDTVHLFVNHWPSRSGGQSETEQKRMYVARILKSKTDSIFRNNKNARIILTGDFNDEPTDKSLLQGLKAIKPGNISGTGLYNLSFYYAGTSTGTLKYKGTWNIFDQMIVSGNLLVKNRLYTQPQFFRIYNEKFLLKQDDRHMGFRPFRTYRGFYYEGGFSDHLPVILDLIEN